MFARDRQELIVDIVRAEGSIRVGDLSRRVGASEMTVRRDLHVLTSMGLIDRVHGGAAAPTNEGSFEPGFDIKRGRQMAEKSAIAAAALTMIRPNTAVGLSAGTTTFTLAERLRAASEEVTVVTNSPSIAHVLYGAGPRVTTVLTGGTRTPSDALVGPLATSAIESLNLDVLFLGVHGIDAGTGYTTPNLAESETNRALVASASKVVVLADHTKWGVRGLAQIAPLSGVSVVVSDDGLADAARAALDDAGVELVIAASDSSGSTLDNRTDHHGDHQAGNRAAQPVR